MILVDTNVILDVFEEDPAWADWSQTQLDRAALNGTLLLNPVTYAELSVAFRRIEKLESMLAQAGFIVDSIPREALFLAGKVFLQYHRQKGTKQGVLPDFFIGAHASELGIPLLTRDKGRFARYLPTLSLIAPGAPG